MSRFSKCKWAQRRSPACKYNTASGPIPRSLRPKSVLSSKLHQFREPLSAISYELSQGQLGGRTGVPKPLAASQPAIAGNPLVSQPLVEPFSTSVKASNPCWYSQGFRNPSGGFPSASSASLTKATMPAMLGADALVPSTSFFVAFQTVT